MYYEIHGNLVGKQFAGSTSVTQEIFHVWSFRQNYRMTRVGNLTRLNDRCNFQRYRSLSSFVNQSDVSWSSGRKRFLKKNRPNLGERSIPDSIEEVHKTHRRRINCSIAIRLPGPKFNLAYLLRIIGARPSALSSEFSLFFHLSNDDPANRLCRLSSSIRRFFPLEEKDVARRERFPTSDISQCSWCSCLMFLSLR